MTSAKDSPTCQPCGEWPPDMPVLTLRNLYQMMEADSRLAGLSWETRHALRRYLPALKRLMEREEERAKDQPGEG
jgi:hypothetical protein